MTTTSLTADNLFRPPDTERPSDADKLQDIRNRLRLRKRELRQTERHERQETRVATPASSS